MYVSAHLPFTIVQETGSINSLLLTEEKQAERC